MSTGRWAIVTLVALCGGAAAAMAACGGDNSSTPGPDSGTDTTVGSDTGAESGGEAGPDVGNDSPPPPPDGGMESGPNCAQTMHRQQCIRCCAGEHEAGAATRDQAIIMCACQATECKSVCMNSLCASPPTQPMMGDPCSKCVTASLDAKDGGDGGGCVQAVTQACNADPDCLAYDQCIKDSMCNQKGGGGDGGHPEGGDGGANDGAGD